MDMRAPSPGVLGILLATVRGHVVETALVVLAASAVLLGMVWHDDTPVATRAFVGEERTDQIDATFVSTLLEVRDGDWAVRHQDTVVVPTLGVREFPVRHACTTGLLFPQPSQLWAAGGPLLRRRVAEWEIESSYRVIKKAGVPAVGVEEAWVSAGGWRTPTVSGVALLDTPAIPTGFNPLGRPMGYLAEDGRVLHVATLTSGDVEALRDVGAWRSTVREAAERLATDASAVRDSPQARASWWRAHAGAVLHTAALAAALRVPEAAHDLAELRGDLDRDLSSSSPGARFVGTNATQALDGALTILSEDVTADTDDSGVVALLSHFAAPARALAALATIHADAPAGALLARMRGANSAWTPMEWSVRPRPRLISWMNPVLLLALIGVVSWGGGPRVRRRDAFATMGALLFASTGMVLTGHVTTGSVGLMALALILARLAGRGAIQIPHGVPRALACAALLLPLGSVLRLPTLDAAGRALAFVGIAWMALGPLAPRLPASDAPRRPERKRHILWASLQLLAVTGCVLALLLAMLDPTSWSTRAPGAKWVLVAVGLVLSLAAGVVAFARGGRARPQPAAACAVTIAAAVHVASLVVAPFPHGRLSGSGELGRVGMTAAAVAGLFVVLRLFVAARAHRELPAAATAADHPPR